MHRPATCPLVLVRGVGRANRAGYAAIVVRSSLTAALCRSRCSSHMTEIKLGRVRARLEHPLQCPLVSHQACAGHRFDYWVDLEALFEGVQCREREADFGPTARP